MSVKTVIELNEKELKDIICEKYDLQKSQTTIRISKVEGEYHQGDSTTIYVEAPRQTQSEKTREDAQTAKSYYEK